MSPYDAIPPLAGLASHADAARVGWSVHENVRRLLRLQWAERRLMATMVARLTAEPVWEVKCAFALQQWQCAERVERIRARIAEMRNPVPRLDAPPDDGAALDAFLRTLAAAAGTRELLTGIHGVALPALARAYREHLDGSNPLVDQPTRAIVRGALLEVEEAVAWGDAALRAVGAAEEWKQRLEAMLRRAGGIAGPELGESVDPPPPSAPPDFHPRRDERFAERYNFDFPPHVVYAMPEASPEERNLALLCKRTLEMDVPEMMASFMTERADQPWEFYRDYSRQLWDEARHAMMGSVALEARGIDWKREVPLNVSFALRLNLHADPLERQIMLFAIEQSLMPAETGKRSEYETAIAAGDALSAHFHDYDWADEVLHAQIGRRMLRRDDITAADARDRAQAIHEKTWAALDRYRQLDQQREWWPAFVKRVLGIESVLATAARPELRIFSE